MSGLVFHYSNITFDNNIFMAQNTFFLSVYDFNDERIENN